MDYVVGSIAALISGNVTPNRPKLIRKALTPTKHQASPNVTPKSELVEDRSIFLSPSVQKKKAIVKKSPKRIFQNPDLDVTDSNESATLSSPKADKVKKHLKGELEGEDMGKQDKKSPKVDKPIEDDIQASNENTPKKKKKRNSESNCDVTADASMTGDENISTNDLNTNKSPKKKKQRRLSVLCPTENETVGIENKESNKQENKKEMIEQTEKDMIEQTKTDNKENKEGNKKKNKRRKKKSKQNKNVTDNLNKDDTEKVDEEDKSAEIKETKAEKPKKKNKKGKKKAKVQNSEALKVEVDLQKEQEDNAEDSDTDEEINQKSKKMFKVNPNAITEKDSDSEHDSDDEIESENEQINNEVLKTEPPEDSSDEEEVKKKPEKPEKKVKEPKDVERNNEEEIKRTIFVGNVPFSPKCKKEIKKIFSKHGQIETIRIRTVPVKDARVTPKLAVIKNELHPERSTVNVYVKFADVDSVEKALSENNALLGDKHLRVSRSDVTGAQHDPRRAVFVGNLPFALEDDELRAKFHTCGDIESVRIIRDKKTNAGKGFGYVNFASKDGVELALNLPEADLTMKNRIIRVKRCTQMTHRQAQKRDSGNNRMPQKRQFGNNRMDRKGFNRNDRKEDEGALRRIMKKRQHQEGGDGPPNKRQKNINQPHKEKKTRQEFVGMIAEKKKKQKFNKGQKKKKAISEILTK